MQQCPTRRVEKARRRCQRGVLQLAQTKAKIDLKQGIPNQAGELEARGMSLTPSREAFADHAETASEGGMQDSRCFDSPQAHVEEVVRSPLKDHDRMSSGRQYCLKVTVYEVTKRGRQALPTALLNSAGIVNLMRHDLDVTEAVILDHIMAILYVGQCSAGEGLTRKEAQACIKHFSPYVEWRGMAVKWEFQALTLAEGQEEIRAHEAQSKKTLRGHGRPRVAKPPASMAEKVPMGMDCSPRDLKKKAKTEKWSRNYESNLAASPLDQNNSASGRQLPRRSMGLPQDMDTSHSGYYSEDSDFDSVLMTSVATSGASTPVERQTRRTFDRCINCKVALPKLNDESSMNGQWIWLADVCRYIDSGCSMSILESEINKSLLNGFWGVWFRMNQMLGDTVEAALNKMMMTDQHQHSNGLLQEFNVITQRANEPIGSMPCILTWQPAR